MDLYQRNIAYQDGLRPELMHHDHDIYQWIESLPKADIDKTTHYMHQAIMELSQSHITTSRKLAILTRFKPVLDYINNSLVKQHILNFAEQRDKQHAALTVLNSLEAQVIALYQQLISQLAGANIDPALRASTYYHCLRYLSGYILRCYQLYTAIPANYWLQVNQLYNYAEQHKLHLYLVENNDLQQQQYSVEDLYKHILLFAAANPYNFQPQEMNQVYQHLKKVIDLTSLRKTYHRDASHVMFLEQDQAPTHVSFVNAAEFSQLSRYLETHTITKYLKQAHTKQMLQPHIVDKLLLTWSNSPKRQYQRIQQSGSIKTSIGFTTTHYFMSNQDNNLPEQVQISPKRAQPSLHHKDVSNKKPTLNIESWDLINTSPDGYCLGADAQFPTNIRAGDIVGIKESADKQSCHLGTIRWLRFTDTKHLNLGIQLLAPTALAAQLKYTCPENKRHSTDAFFVPESPTLKLPSTIITSTLPLRSDEQLLMICHGKHTHIKLKEQLLATGSFKQYTYVELG